MTIIKFLTPKSCILSFCVTKCVTTERCKYQLGTEASGKEVLYHVHEAYEIYQTS